MVFHRQVLISIAVFCSAGSSALAATPAEADASLQRAATYLLNVEKDGNWEPFVNPIADPTGVQVYGGQWSGATALATYALLCARVGTTDPHVSSAIDFLTRTQTRGTYALGLRCLVWSALELNPKTKSAATRDLRLLLNNMRSMEPARGLFSYLPPNSRNDVSYDHSVSQFAALGLGALGRQGFEVPTQTWNWMDQSWRAHQDSGGGWGYTFQDPTPRGKLTPSMTAAGIATLLITREFLHQTADCKGNLIDPAVESGMKCLAGSFDGISDVNSFNDNRIETHYTLFGISRIGAASGRKYLGKTDWYRRGADLLVQSQQPDGAWIGAHPPSIETALGVLFLAYGGAPVVVNKLDYSPADKPDSVHWNQRPQDMFNFAGWMSRQLEQRLNFQVVSLSSPPEDLHEAPVLFISGDQALNLTPAEKEKLRRFAEDGGLILGNSDCGSAAFARSFEELGRELFPAHEFRMLPDDHPIFTNEQYPAAKWKPRPQLMSLGNGVRELMIIPGVDLSQQFQLRNTVTHAPLYQLADDIILYAMNRQGLRKKGNTFLVTDDPAIQTTREIKLVRLQYTGNWDPEPGGWRRLAAVMHNQNRIKLSVTTAKLGEGKPFGATLAHLTGTDAVTLAPAQLDELRQFIAGGGTLIIDAAGGSQAFAGSAQDLIIELFGNDGSKGIASPLPPDSDLYKASGSMLTEFTYRNFAKTRVVGTLSSPRLCAVKQNDRLVCYFSREDLGAGLVGQPVDGIIGYEPATATAIMRDVLMYACR